MSNRPTDSTEQIGCRGKRRGAYFWCFPALAWGPRVWLTGWLAGCSTYPVKAHIGRGIRGCARARASREPWRNGRTLNVERCWLAGLSSGLSQDDALAPALAITWPPLPLLVACDCTPYALYHKL